MSLFLRPFETLLNFALSHDLESKDKLKQFDQKCLAVRIIDLDQTIHILIDKQRLLLTSANDTAADLTVSGQAIALAKLGNHPDNLFSPDIDIHGNVQFAKQLRDWLDGFDFDWEQQLARVTGDTLAYPLAHGIRQFASWLKNSQQAIQENCAEYLKEEIQLLPDESQVTAYIHEIDTLRADYDRLAARIARLEGKRP